MKKITSTFPSATHHTHIYIHTSVTALEKHQPIKISHHKQTYEIKSETHSLTIQDCSLSVCVLKYG